MNAVAHPSRGLVVDVEDAIAAVARRGGIRRDGQRHRQSVRRPLWPRPWTSRGGVYREVRPAEADLASAGLAAMRPRALSWSAIVVVVVVRFRVGVGIGTDIGRRCLSDRCRCRCLSSILSMPVPVPVSWCCRRSRFPVRRTGSCAGSGVPSGRSATGSVGCPVPRPGLLSLLVVSVGDVLRRDRLRRRRVRASNLFSMLFSVLVGAV